MLCRNEFSSRLQKRRLFLCFRMLLRFWYATVCILMCEEHHLYCVFQGGISGLRYSRYRNGFRWLHQRVCKRSGSWTSAEIFQNNVCGSAVPCCPASSAPQITPRQSSTPCSLVCATGLPRRNLGFAEMKTGGGCTIWTVVLIWGRSETVNYFMLCKVDEDLWNLVLSKISAYAQTHSTFGSV